VQLKISSIYTRDGQVFTVMEYFTIYELVLSNLLADTLFLSCVEDRRDLPLVSGEISA
jgi:hypothetical protein